MGPSLGGALVSCVKMAVTHQNIILFLLFGWWKTGRPPKRLCDVLNNFSTVQIPVTGAAAFPVEPERANVIIRVGADRRVYVHVEQVTFNDRAIDSAEHNHRTDGTQVGSDALHPSR